MHELYGKGKIIKLKRIEDGEKVMLVKFETRFRNLQFPYSYRAKIVKFLNSDVSDKMDKFCNLLKEIDSANAKIYNIELKMRS